MIRPIVSAGRTVKPSSPWFRWRSSAVLCLVLAALNMAVWRWANPPLPAADAQLPVAGLAYNGFQRWQSPLQQMGPQPEEMARDLALLSRMTARLRTYSSSEMPTLFERAREQGLQITAGVWLDGQPERDAREIQAIEAAVVDDRRRAQPDPPDSRSAGLGQGKRVIERVIAGNETQLHRLLTPAELLAIIARLQKSLDVPVSTAEPWHVWLDKPELANAVDFIAVHLLPYWEGVPVEVAVHEVWRRYEELRRAYPGKPIVVAEVGWPSGGPVVEKRVHGVLNRAGASPLEQARFVREFVASAQRRPDGVDYFLMEAIDQPWKVGTEGAAGPHWGVVDARRQAKFAWEGPVQQDPYWLGKAAAATALGLLILGPFLLRFAHLRLSARVAFGISVCGVASFGVVLATLPLVDYLRVLDGLLLALLVPALLLMAAILLSHAFEFSELFWDGHLRRQARARPHPAGTVHPMVSIHLACCNEPADMVLAAIKSLQALDWPNLEILVVDNNSSDPRCWQPVQAFVQAQRQRGDRRLRFIHLPRWPGYKAGALNEALRRTDPLAAWVAVVDADYVVNPAWLSRLGGWLADPSVAVVQSPQAHRNWAGDRLSRMMNWEFEGFFRLGMHHRHERNAIIQHGTMTIIRTSALRMAGGWNTACVCEDTELGLRLLQKGWRQVYVDEVLGAGLVPQDFAAYQRQRQRWARGGMQILRGHARALLGPASPLTLGQRYHFLAGWLPWFGDTLHLVFTLTAVLWSAGCVFAPEFFRLPSPMLALPLLVFFLARLAVVPALYLRRVSADGWAVLGAAWAGMALSHSIARGVLAGLMAGPAAFHVTRKSPVLGSHPSGGGWRSVREEGILLTALLGVAALMVSSTPEYSSALLGWGTILVLQALPYGAALSCAVMDAARRPAVALKAV